MVERARTKSTHGAEFLKRIAKKSISRFEGFALSDLVLCSVEGFALSDWFFVFRRPVRREAFVCVIAVASTPAADALALLKISVGSRDTSGDISVRI